jgi:hypothetical protein
MKIHDMTNPWGFLRMNILLILLILALAMVSGSYLGHAANHYILDGGTGDGSAWDNALDDLPAIRSLLPGRQYR